MRRENFWVEMHRTGRDMAKVLGQATITNRWYLFRPMNTASLLVLFVSPHVIDPKP